MKKILLKVLKIFGIFVGSIVALLVIASIVMMIVVDKKMVENKIKEAMHRQVTIGKVSIGIFSIVSGVHVKDVEMSNFKTEQQLKALEGKPVPANDLFVKIEDLQLKFRILPLLQKKFELTKFVLHGAKVNIVKGANGGFNFDDLLAPKKLTAEEKAEEAKKKAEEAAKGPKKPFTADDLPIAVTVGEAGIENSTVNYTDLGMGQKFQIYGLTAKVYDIKIDPTDLVNKNSVKIYFKTGIKSVGAMRSGSVDAFDIGFKVDGVATPFDAKTKQVDPALALKMKLPYGTLQGLAILKKIASLSSFGPLLGNSMDFIKGGAKVQWKDSPAYVDVTYKGGNAELKNGSIKNSDFAIAFDGKTNINAKSLNLKLDMILTEKRSSTITNGIRKNVEAGLKKVGAKKTVNAKKIAETAIKPMLNAKGLVYFRFMVTGTYSNPNPDLTHPKLANLDELLKGVALEAAKGAAMDAAGKALKGGLKGLKLKF